VLLPLVSMQQEGQNHFSPPAVAEHHDVTWRDRVAAWKLHKAALMQAGALWCRRVMSSWHQVAAYRHRLTGVGRQIMARGQRVVVSKLWGAWRDEVGDVKVARFRAGHCLLPALRAWWEEGHKARDLRETQAQVSAAVGVGLGVWVLCS
jgi:hypothetical protein